MQKSQEIILEYWDVIEINKQEWAQWCHEEAILLK